LGVIAIARRDLTTARERLEESRAVAERHGLAPGAADFAVLRLALIDHLEGDYAHARERLADLLRRATDRDSLAGNPANQHLVALALGNVARAEGRYEEARTLLHGTLRRLRQRGVAESVLDAVCMVGLLEIARGATARGVTLIAACARGEGPIGTVHQPDVRVEVPDFLNQARQTLGEVAYAAAWGAGQAMTPEQAVAYALEEVPGAAHA
jgi:hypothetical protein